MTTATAQSIQSSNNTIQLFKSDNTLELQGINIIARKEDGYINLSQLCQAGNKSYKNWRQNKKTEDFLHALSQENEIDKDELIKYTSGSNSERATWGHPQVAINNAQWMSPVFDVKVSKWIYEMMLTGSVTLGQEKSNKELEEKFQKKISLLQNTVESVVAEKHALLSSFQHLSQRHDSLRLKVLLLYYK